MRTDIVAIIVNIVRWILFNIFILRIYITLTVLELNELMNSTISVYEKTVFVVTLIICNRYYNLSSKMWVKGEKLFFK
jgi:hypothetical protein